MTRMTETDLHRQKENQPLIIGISFLSGMVGLLPLPVAPDLAIDLLRVFLVRHLAEKRQLSLGVPEARIISGAQASNAERIALTSGLVLPFKLAWRRVGRGLLLLLRLEDVGHTYVIATAFDYYCLRYHQGGSVTPEQADALGKVIQKTYSRAIRSTARQFFERAISSFILVGASLPKNIGSLLSSLFSNPARLVPEHLLKQLEEQLFSKVAQFFEEELLSFGAATLESYSRIFDEAWKEGPSPIRGSAE
jgi:hypothetical protein